MNERLDLSAIMMCPLWKFTYLAGGNFPDIHQRLHEVKHATIIPTTKFVP